MYRSAFSLFLFFWFITFAIAQKVPVIETTIGNKLSYTDQQVKDYTKYMQIEYDMYDKGTQYEDLPESDRLFVEKYRKKNEIAEEDSDIGITELIGPGCSWYCGAIYRVQVSSTLESQGKNDYSKNNLSDDDTSTAWVEGVKGYGIGEYIEFIFPYYAARATECHIANGYNKNPVTWKNNSRVKSFDLYEDDKLIARVNLKDTRDEQIFQLPHPIPNRSNDEERGNIMNEDATDDYDFYRPVKLKFVITEVYKGDKYDDTALSELIFDGMDVHCLAEGTEIEMFDGRIKTIENVYKGDTVLMYNIGTGNFEDAIVEERYMVIHDNLIQLNFGENGENYIITTKDHPFLTFDGWKSYYPAKTKLYERYLSELVNKYEEGSTLLIKTQDGGVNSVEIKSINELSDKKITYTLQLNKNGAFVAKGLLVGQE